jgi:hypothetical protein
LAIQYEFDKNAPIDLIGYPMNVAAKVTSFTIWNNAYKLLHPSLKSEFQKMDTIKETNKRKYIDLENNLTYKVYTTITSH